MFSLFFFIAAVSACDTNQMGYVSATDFGDLSGGEPERPGFDTALDQVCGRGGPTEAGRQLMPRMPYLQRVTARSAALVWTTTMDSLPDVIVTGPGGAELERATVTVDASAPLPKGRQLVAELEGLQPDTTYCYEIRTGDHVLLESTGFRTAPAPGQGRAIAFATMGDLGLASEEQLMVRDQLARVAIDFALINGDVAYDDGTLSQFERYYFDVYERLLAKVPFFVASGNHDYRTDDAGPFRQVFSLFENGGPGGRERWYSFDWGDVHVVVLDTEKVGPQQGAWLEADLKRNRLPWTVVTAHRPAYSSGRHGSDESVQRRFVPLFEKYGVQLVIAGHDHHYERTREINGVTYLVSGAGGRGTYEAGNEWFTAFSEQVSHFTYVRIEGDRMVLYAIDASGQVFDTATIRR